jgi:hypothetical protein
MKKIFFLISLVLYVVISRAGSLTDMESLSISLFVFCFLTFLDDLGKKVVILDLTVLMGILTCLVMPVIFYHVYTKENPLARLWIKYMPIPSDDYFSFALPGIVAMILGLKLPLGKLKVNTNPGIYMEHVKAYLTNSPHLGLTLMAIGVGSGMISFLVPTGLVEVFHLMAHLTFVGVFYVFYSPNKYKKYIVPGVLLLMVVQSSLNGMFGELIFITALALVLILLGKKILFRRKLALALVGIVVIVLIQSVKKEYRQKAWRTEGGADPLYFGQLIAERVASPSTVLDPTIMFVTAVRMNQGWLVAVTINLVPRKHSFGRGEPLLASVAAAFIPRVVWPDKPEAGGKANLKRFWGFNLVGFSTNLGPLGEAYANFDRAGGIIYMFFYGLFFNLALFTILKMGERRPTLILWLPYLFFTAIAVETDLLSTMGALVKGIIFTWAVFKFFDSVYRIKL